MSTSLQGRLGLLFVAFFLLIAISVGATFRLANTQRQDAAIINVAGRQRMLVQHMTMAALQVKATSDPAQRAMLATSMHTFDETLSALHHGGQVSMGSDQHVILPATRSPEIVTALQRTERTWEAFRAELEGILVDATPISVSAAGQEETLNDLSTTLLRQSDAVVTLYQEQARRRLARLQLIQGLFVGGAIVLLSAGFIVIRRSVILPLERLGSVVRRQANSARRPPNTGASRPALVAGRIGDGNLNSPTAIEGPREIRRLARSYETMQRQLRHAQEELIEWTEMLERRVEERTHQLTALAEVSDEIVSHLDIDHVLRSITTKTQELLDSEVAFLCLLDDDGDMLSLESISGSPEAIRSDCTPIQQPLVSHVLTEDVALSCETATCLGSCGIMGKRFRQSHLAAPLRTQGRVIGALCVGSSREAHFDSESQQLLTRLATSAAIALDNARLYEQAEHAATLEERQRIAAEMHDDLLQSLSYLRIKIHQIATELDAGNVTEKAQELERIGDSIDELAHDVRETIVDLQKSLQPPVSLQDRLAALAGDLAGRAAPEIELRLNGDAPLHLPADDLEQIARVTQEAVLNAAQHAGASHIEVRLECHGSEALLRVTDNGCGFDPQVLPADGKHFGIRIMRARAARIGGRLTIASTPGEGTRVELCWPITYHLLSQEQQGVISS